MIAAHSHRHTHVHDLPQFAPSSVRLADLPAGNATNLSRLAKTKLRKMQDVDGLIDGFFRATGRSSP
ncbi:hypothetical protein [Dactylosporangium sp. NPDC005555]|uniref:hypothetical protein n=1 Tax=Dactylosporangium sp. NPDC005555 TaxID=3154889 RepID=UPI0033BC45AE